MKNIQDNRLIFLLGSGAFTILTSFSLLSEYKVYQFKNQKLQRLLDNINNRKYYNLSVIDSEYFPWVTSNENLDYWEFKLLMV